MTKRTFRTSTPWGVSDHEKEAAPGIVWYSTPSHGGYGLSPDRANEFDRLIQGFKPFAGRGWFEEDEDAAIIPLVFFSSIRPDARKVYFCLRSIQGSIRRWETNPMSTDWSPVSRWLMSSNDAQTLAVIAGQWQRDNASLFELRSSFSPVHGYPSGCYSQGLRRIGDGKELDVVLTRRPDDYVVSMEQIEELRAMPLQQA